MHYTCTREKFCYENCFGILSKQFLAGYRWLGHGLGGKAVFEQVFGHELVNNGLIGFISRLLEYRSNKSQIE